MRIVSACVVGLALLAVPASAQDAAVIEHGQKVYAAQKCGVCHSIAGIGNKKGPLDEAGAKLTAEEIREWLVNAPEMTKKTKAARKPLMKDYAKLPKEDIDALVAYMLCLKS